MNRTISYFFFIQFLTPLLSLNLPDIDVSELIGKSRGFKIAGSHIPWKVGSAIASADINNDGIPDIILGSQPSGTNTGSVSVIYGRQSEILTDIDLQTPGVFTNGVGFRIIASAAQDYLGWSVARAGDFNNDGIDDIIIGATQVDFAGRTDAGAAYVIYGKQGGRTTTLRLINLNINEVFQIQGATGGDSLGTSVSGAGDVNGDGIADVIVGAPHATSPTGGVRSEGVCYVVYGKQGGPTSDLDLSTGLNPSDGFMIMGALADDSLGFGVTGGGDVNNDGISDIIVASYTVTPMGRSRAGSVYVIYGKKGGLSNINLSTGLSLNDGFQIIGAVAQDYLGLSVSVGDVNGDEIPDVITGAYGASPSGRTQAGSVYVIYGKKGGQNTIDLSSLSLSVGFRIDGADAGDSLGYSVSFAGDINEDGIGDIILGSPRPSDNNGRGYVIYGQRSRTSNIDLANALPISDGFRIIDSVNQYGLGGAVRNAGDFNQDGVPDLLIGAPRYSADYGAAYVIYSGCHTTNCAECSSSARCQACKSGYLLDQTTTFPTCSPSSNIRDLCTRYNTPTYDEVSFSSLYFYPNDESCKPFCVDPYIVQGINCVLPLTPEEIREIDIANFGANSIARLVTGGLILQSFFQSSNANGASIGTLSKIYEHTRYYDIVRSPALELFYLTTRSVPGTVILGPGLSNQTVDEKFPYRVLPTIFQRTNVHSSFLVNFFSNLESLLTFLGGVAIIVGIGILVDRYDHVPKLIKRYYEKLKFFAISFLIMQYYDIYAEILFFSALEFMTFHGGDAYDWLSFFMATGFIAFSVFVLFLHWRLIRSYQRVKKATDIADPNDHKLEIFQKKYKPIRILYKDFKDSSFIRQSFLFFATARAALCCMLMAVLYTSPIAQAVIISLTNIAMIFYLLYKVPFKDRFNVVQQLAFEFDLLLVDLCFLIMACLEARSINDRETRYILSQIVIWGIFASKGFVLISLIPQVYFGIRKYLKKRAEKKKRKAQEKLAKPKDTLSTQDPARTATTNSNEEKLSMLRTKTDHNVPEHVENSFSQEERSMANQVNSPEEIVIQSACSPTAVFQIKGLRPIRQISSPEEVTNETFE